MKNYLFCIGLLLSVVPAHSQVTEAEKQLVSQTKDSVNGWKIGGMVNLGTSQTSLTNWSAGGQSSIAVNGLLNLYARNKRDRDMWENYLDLGYGSLKEGSKDWWKTDDKIDFTSKYGYKISKNLYISGLVNFKTQFANGYNYPNDSVRISGFLAPGYLLGAIGLEYRPGDNFNLFIAPLTGKLTFVRIRELSDAGAFGVHPGDNIYSEFGSYLRAFLKINLMENISFQTKLDLFSNYLHNPQNIDVNWECLLSMKVNKFISATLATDLVYDDDITIPGKTGPRVQFKEILAVGLSYKF